MYDTFSADYDRFVNWDARLKFEIPFILEKLGALEKNNQPLRILDSACGSGMHAIALAKRGYQVSGADFSRGMVSKAHRNAEEENVEMRFEEAGFGALKTSFQHTSGFPFDSLLCLGNSLPQVLTEKDLLDTLTDFAACLQPGGLLLIQNRNFNAVLSHKERWMEPQSIRESDHEWIFNRFYDFEPDGLIGFNMQILQRAADQPWQQKVMNSKLRPWLQTELLDALKEVGFNSVECMGSMENIPFNPSESPNLVLVARS
ncbi:MAG: class I SAM-dependent methyltransferase [Anaerolineaceae bacterium]|nr:class I SAM-dependent methyltransferase [Anaerolineaceae bacterium]